MKNYVLTWTDPAGQPRDSLINYGKSSADERKAQLEAEGCTHVEITVVKPGARPVSTS